MKEYDLDMTMVNVDPRRGDITIDPDMELICLWCGKNYKPYNTLVLHDFSFYEFCSPRCFGRYHSIPGKIWMAMKWIVWKPQSMFMIWYDRRFSLPCPVCGVDMLVMLKDIQCCYNPDCDAFGDTLTIVSREDRIFRKEFQ